MKKLALVLLSIAATTFAVMANPAGLKLEWGLVILMQVRCRFAGSFM